MNEIKQKDTYLKLSHGHREEMENTHHTSDCKISGNSQKNFF